MALLLITGRSDLGTVTILVWSWDSSVASVSVIPVLTEDTLRESEAEALIEK